MARQRPRRSLGDLLMQMRGIVLVNPMIAPQLERLHRLRSGFLKETDAESRARAGDDRREADAAAAARPCKGETAMEDKSAYRQKLEAKLDQWAAEIDKLQAKAAEAGADARVEYQRQVDELRDKQKDARAKLDELDDAGGDAWEDLKGGIEKAWEDLGSAVSAARERFR